MEDEQWFYDGDETMENTMLYSENGLPPIDLGDSLCEGRYTILHKLGKGCSATVWLAHDVKANRYCALKTFIASNKDNELRIQTILTKLIASSKANKHLTTTLDHFQFDSINGHHLCLVYEFMGPNLHDLLDDYKFKPEVARKLAKQLVETVALLHSHEIVCGDLSTSNILIKYQDLQSLTPDELIESLGQPITRPVHALPGKEDFLKHAPKELVSPAYSTKMSTALLVPELALIDLNDAVKLDDTSTGADNATQPMAAHLNEAGPEFVYEITTRHTKQSDIWSLACCLFAIRSSQPLVESSSGNLVPVARSIQRLVGPLPTSWVSILRENFDPTDFKSLIVSAAEQRALHKTKDLMRGTLEQRVRSIGEWLPWVTMTEDERREWLVSEGWLSADDTDIDSQVKFSNPPPAKLSDEEYRDFYDLLSKMVRMLPEDRISVEEVLAHPWLNRSYEDLDDYSNWILLYDYGRDTEEHEGESVYESDSSVGEGSPIESEVEEEITEEDTEEPEQFAVSKLLGLPVPSVGHERITFDFGARTADDIAFEQKEASRSRDKNRQENLVISQTGHEASTPGDTARTHSQLPAPISHTGVVFGDVPAGQLINGSRISGQLRGGTDRDTASTNHKKAKSGLQVDDQKRRTRNSTKGAAADELIPWWHGALCIGVVLAVYGAQKLLRKLYQ